MHRFFKKERLLLTLIVIFSVAAAIFGTILKHTAYKTQNIDAPGIAFPFLAMYDGTMENLDEIMATLQAEREQEAAEAEEPAAEEAAPEASTPATLPEQAPAETQLPEEPSVPEEPEAPEFQTVDESYFTDALFIGDSRTDGLKLYAPFDGADYFSTTGLSVLGCLSESVEVAGYGTLSLEQLLAQATYGKIYISLGINDVGSDHNYLEGIFKEILETVRTAQPDAIVYIMGSLHVAKNRAINQPVFESNNVDSLNNRFAANADGENIFYINPNEIFDDAEGYLISDYTGDNVHLYAKYYEDWDAWMCRNAIVKPGMAYPGSAPVEENVPEESEAAKAPTEASAA